jgi:hypothetical protein
METQVRQTRNSLAFQMQNYLGRGAVFMGIKTGVAVVQRSTLIEGHV